MNRLFRPGDRVQLKHGSPVMEVMKYEMEKSPLSGEVFSDHELSCVWYENGERKTGVFDQRTLFKVAHGDGLFED